MEINPKTVLTKRLSVIASKLIEIFTILGYATKLPLVQNGIVDIKLANNQPLFNVRPRQIKIASIALPQEFMLHPSPLADGFVKDAHIQSLLKTLTEKGVGFQLNHTGLCYPVNSVAEELARLVAEIKNTQVHLYSEKYENEKSEPWLFIGDTTNWRDPAVELVPIPSESSWKQDKYIDYWLPNIQIDINTGLPAEFLESAIKTAFHNRVLPFRAVVVGGVVYVIRARLGIQSGVNIMLDLGTDNRNTEYQRKHLWNKLI